MSDGQTRILDHDAQPYLVAALVATRQADLPGFEDAVRESRTWLHPGHGAHPYLDRAILAATSGWWACAYLAIRAAIAVLMFTVPVDLPASPMVADCKCGAMPLSGALFCAECGADLQLPLTVSRLPVASADDPDLWTDLPMTLSSVALHGTTVVITYGSDAGLLHDEPVDGLVGRLVFDLGPDPAAAAAIDQAHARLREWSESVTTVRLLEGPGRLSRLVAPDGASVTLPSGM